jgi:hypothetical protein
MARLAGAVRRKFAREDNNVKPHRVGRKASIRTLQRTIGERPRGLGFAKPEQNIGIRNEEENLIQVHQVGNQAVSSDRDRCPPIAGHTVRPRRTGDGIGCPAVVLVVG